MTVRWDRVPAEAKPARTRGKVRRGTWRCGGANGCGELLDDVTFAFAERHADSHGGARLECATTTEATP